MQHNSIVIQPNAAVAQLHKKCDFGNFTLIFSFKLNSVDKTKKQTNLTSLILVFEVLPFRVHVA